MLDDVVTEQELSAVSDAIQLLEAAVAGTVGKGQGRPGVGAVSGRGHQGTVDWRYLEVQRNALT